MVAALGAGPVSKPMGARTLPPQHHVWCSWDLPQSIKTSRTSLVRDNERYLAFSPAVPQAFLVHSGEVRHKIVGHKKVTLENKKVLTYYSIQLYYSIYYQEIKYSKRYLDTKYGIK